ncbi:MAG: hypothetical protein ACI4JN_08700 [Ruminococcus sp.]
MRIIEKYKRFKKAYFILFCAVCDTIENLEKISCADKKHIETARLLTEQAECLKAVQQQTEEIIISD